MKTKLASTQVVKSLVKMLRDFDYDLVEDDGNYIAYSGETVVMRALKHSSGRNYLLQYDTNIVSEVA